MVGPARLDCSWPTSHAAVNTTRGGSLHSSVTVGVVPAIWGTLGMFVAYYSVLIRYRRNRTPGFDGIYNQYNKPVLSDMVDSGFILVVLGVRVGLAAVGILIGMGYNRFVGSVSDDAPVDSDAA